MYGPWAALLPIRATGVEDDDPLVGVFCFPFLFFCVGTLTSSNASDCLNRAAGDPGDRGIKSPGGRSAPSLVKCHIGITNPSLLSSKSSAWASKA
jgi:hypothetical protein